MDDTHHFLAGPETDLAFYVEENRDPAFRVTNLFLTGLRDANLLKKI
jgi:hypothetical protein